MNLGQFLQRLRPTKEHAAEQERHLRQAMEAWEQRAFSLNAAIGLLRAALQINQQHEQTLQQQQQHLPTQEPNTPSNKQPLLQALSQQSLHIQHLHIYTLRQLYQQLMDIKKQLIQQGQEDLLPQIQAMPDERRTRLQHLYRQSLEGIQQVSVSRQESASLIDLEAQRQRPLPPSEEEAHSEEQTSTSPSFQELQESIQALLQTPDASKTHIEPSPEPDASEEEQEAP